MLRALLAPQWGSFLFLRACHGERISPNREANEGDIRQRAAGLIRSNASVMISRALIIFGLRLLASGALICEPRPNDNPKARHRYAQRCRGFTLYFAFPESRLLPVFFTWIYRWLLRV